MPRVKKEITKKSTVKRLQSAAKKSRKSIGLSIPVYSLAGRLSGITLALPKELFAVKISKDLLSQAIRVYTTNQKIFTAKTKTRGEVEGSTAKVWRQKGTGRARHGAIRAPIFVGGGIVFGPSSRKVRLDLPKRMKKAALFAALSSKVIDENVMGLSGIEKATGKTKEISKLMESFISDKRKKINALIVTGERNDNVLRAVKNIPTVDTLSANLINAYEVLRHELLFITKDAVEKLSQPATKDQK